MSNRKTVAVANRERAEERRKKARLEGKCQLLCGRPITPGLNYFGKLYTTCEQCRKRMPSSWKASAEDTE